MLELLGKGKTKIPNGNYDDFVTWANKQTEPQQLPYGTSPQTATGWRRMTVTGVDSSTMWGSPYKTYFTYDSNSTRILRHALPTAAMMDDHITNKRTVLMYFNYVANRPSYLGLNRNGYQSPSYGSYNGTYLSSIVYWDYTLNKVMRYNPFTDSVPVDFDFNLAITS